MPTKRLTAAMVERIAPPVKGQVEYFDKSLPGFALRVSYRGTRSWILMTRIQGKLTRLTLGEWPVMSLAEAHDAAREAKRQAKAGNDPREVQKQRQLAFKELQLQTFGIMADQFLDRYARPKLRTSTIAGYEAALKGKLTEAWQDRPITSITRRDLMALLDGLEAQGKHGMAKLTMAYLRKFFGWCAERDAISEMPTHRVRLNGALKARERALTLDELHRVWAAADRLGGIGGAIVKLLILTGQRRFETSMMRWRDLSGFENGNPVWLIPGEIAKNHRAHDVPLPPEAAAIIRAQPVKQITTERGQQDSELVFTTTGERRWAVFSRFKVQLDKQIAMQSAEDGTEPLAPWTYHDLRRSLVTGMNDRGIAPPHIIESVVNHAGGYRSGVAGVYNRAGYLDERRRALQAWARLVTTAADGGNVIPMRTGTTDNVEPATA